MIGGVSGLAGIDGKKERRHRHRLSISKKKSFPRSCTTKEEEDLHRFQRCVRCQQTLVQLHALNSEDTFFTEQCIHLHAPAIYWMKPWSQARQFTLAVAQVVCCGSVCALIFRSLSEEWGAWPNGQSWVFTLWVLLLLFPHKQTTAEQFLRWGLHLLHFSLLLSFLNFFLCASCTPVRQLCQFTCAFHRRIDYRQICEHTANSTEQNRCIA